jgi:exodeoxyribonuclease VII large subunit
VLFSREAVRLRFELRDGLAVRCRGRLTIYEGRGKFQMTVSVVEPAGAGALALAFEQLKQRLAAEGLFDQDKKRPLPFLPRRVGVVTSPHGAVLQDIIRVAHRRFPAAILLAPAPVQGEGASALLTRALERLARVPDVDVIIVARGGGSLEDLWAFNDEGLARAIAACRVPVISAVGHETDFTIADFVADVRAPTPSAAAELAVPVASELRDALAVLRRRQLRAASASLQARHLGLERLRGRLGDPRRMVDARRQRLDDWQARATEALRAAGARRRGELRQAETRLFRAHPQRRIAAQRSALAALEGELREAARARLASMAEALATLERRLPAAAAGLTDRRRRNLEALAATLEALSPLRVLDRGYGLVRRDDGSVLRDTDDVSVGARIAIRLARGALDAEVVAVTPAPTDAPGNAAPRDGATPEVATRKGATRRGTK